MNSPFPFVSIIIPHFNDHTRLGYCLAQLDNQSYPADRYEIIVVDNGSDESPEKVTAVSSHSKLLFENKPGSYAARNRGITEAQGEIVAFTDSDCLPEHDWLEQGVRAIKQDDSIGFVAGPVEIFPENADHSTVPELYELLRGFPIKEYMEKWQFGVTANLFTRRSILDVIGSFDESLKSGGDSEWCKRVYTEGFKPIYAEAARVRHPARQSVRDIYRLAQRWAGGIHDIQAKQRPPRLYLVQSFPHDILPPIKKSQHLWSQSQFPILLRLQLIGVEWIVNYAKAFERIRLIFGGRSQRT